MVALLFSSCSRRPSLHILFRIFFREKVPLQIIFFVWNIYFLVYDILWVDVQFIHVGDNKTKDHHDHIFHTLVFFFHRAGQSLFMYIVSYDVLISSGGQHSERSTFVC